MSAGDTLLFALHRSTLEETPAHVWRQKELASWLDDTIAAWQSWSDLHQAYEGPWWDLVHHSGRVLEALSFQPGSDFHGPPGPSVTRSVPPTAMIAAAIEAMAELGDPASIPFLAKLERDGRHVESDS